MDIVHHYVPIRLIRRDGKRTWFFVEERTDAEDTSVSWSEFQRHLKKIGYARQVRPNSRQLVPEKHADALLALWQSAAGN